MYLKCHKRIKDGKSHHYWNVVEHIAGASRKIKGQASKNLRKIKGQGIKGQASKNLVGIVPPIVQPLRLTDYTAFLPSKN